MKVRCQLSRAVPSQDFLDMISWSSSSLQILMVSYLVSKCWERINITISTVEKSHNFDHLKSIVTSWYHSCSWLIPAFIVEISKYTNCSCSTKWSHRRKIHRTKSTVSAFWSSQEYHCVGSRYWHWSIPDFSVKTSKPTNCSCSTKQQIDGDSKGSYQLLRKSLHFDHLKCIVMSWYHSCSWLIPAFIVDISKSTNCSCSTKWSYRG
jgi:hypothetical protein